MSGEKYTLAFGVLAGGKSTRMGQDKAALPWGGRTFLETVLEAGRPFPERLVSLPPRGELSLPGVKTVYDRRPDTGPLEGIFRILSGMQGDACLIVATDMPCLTSSFLTAFAEKYPGSGNLVLTCGGYPEPMCSIYHRDCLPVIEELQSRGLSRPALLFRQVPTRYVAVEDMGFPPETVCNVNCPEDYARVTGKDRQDG